ncbi:hypothetical protein Tco_0875504 [Tanacetum coccineum]|uniref:Uncharacterized protein n=1 Tax=Tanacetum coccineum TaxID=301880 RepID=A0ABQ5BSL3_9ASTR
MIKTEIMMQMVEMMMKERLVGNNKIDIPYDPPDTFGESLDFLNDLLRLELLNKEIMRINVMMVVNTGVRVNIAGEKDENTGGIILSVEFSEELKELLSDEAEK